MRTKISDLITHKDFQVILMMIEHKCFLIIYQFKSREETIKLRWLWNSVYIHFNQRTIGPENAHLKPDLGVLSHNEMTLTLNTHTPLLTS